MSKIIWCDIDCVVADIGGFLLNVIQRTNPSIIKFEDMKYYDMEDYGLTGKQVKDMLQSKEYLVALKTAPIIEGSVEGINELYNSGKIINFLTFRPKINGIEKDTYKWLMEAGIKFNNIFYEKNKLELILDIGVGPMIEDRPEMLYLLNENKIPAVCCPQPWNESVSGEYIHRLPWTKTEGYSDTISSYLKKI